MRKAKQSSQAIWSRIILDIERKKIRGTGKAQREYREEKR